MKWSLSLQLFGDGMCNILRLASIWYVRLAWDAFTTQRCSRSGAIAWTGDESMLVSVLLFAVIWCLGLQVPYVCRTSKAHLNCRFNFLHHVCHNHLSRLAILGQLVHIDHINIQPCCFQGSLIGDSWRQSRTFPYLLIRLSEFGRRYRRVCNVVGFGAESAKTQHEHRALLLSEGHEADA